MSTRPTPPVKYISEHCGLDDMTLQDVCAEIHADNTGSSDPISTTRRAQLISYLQLRTSMWRPSVSQEWEAYDNIIRALCYVTLAEKHWSEK